MTPGRRTLRFQSLDEIMPDRAQLKRTDFYRHVLMPEGWDKLLGLTLWEKNERKSILCLRRAFSTRIRRMASAAAKKK